MYLNTKKNKFILSGLCGIVLFLAVSVFILEKTKMQVQKPAYTCMIDAAQRTENAFSLIHKERLLHQPISLVDDPCDTGLIGDSYTEITTTLGSLEAKRSTTNPNVSAMVVDLLTQCGVKSGDSVAVNLSSSFPAMNIAVICALDAIGADGIIINSVGASTYGANLPDFTYLDMEQTLLDHHMITNHTKYFSLGGADDIGKEMPESVKQTIIDRLKSRGLTFLYYEDLEQNLSVRCSIYDAAGTPSCLINVGGNLLSFGGGTEMVHARNGILLPGETKIPKNSHGLIPFYLSQGVPVIHLLNMKSLLPANGLPFDPQPIPLVGTGDVYTHWQYNHLLAIMLFLGGWIMLILFSKHIIRHHIPL